MPKYNIIDIANIVGGKMIGLGSGCSIESLITDSRRVNNPKTSLFFALAGERNDGHQYIKELYDKGVCNFVITNVSAMSPDSASSASEVRIKADYLSLPANFILVNDSLKALQRFAAYHRKQFPANVIGITGSNGKTMVKEWLYQLMRQDKNIVRSPKSYNSQIGVPLSVWQMSEVNDLAIFEAGISKPGEMEKLQPIILPVIGIFTNVGQAHAQNFESQQELTREKLKLFKDARQLIYCKDYPVLQEEISKPGLLSPDIDLFTWSRKTSARLQVGSISKSHEETTLQGIYKNSFIGIKIPFTDDASIENAIHCWALMLCLGYENELIAERMKLLSPVAMRLEMKEGINHCSVINDSYNSDLGSLAIALDFLNQQKKYKHKTLVLSDILQSGKEDKTLYQEVALLVKQKEVSRLIGIGNGISSQADQFDLDKSFYPTTEAFLNVFSSSLFHNETILLKGARSFGFERISKILQQKAHETVLEINLNALVHNLKYYQSRIRPDTRTMAMVKAFSYGSGNFEIANTLQFHGVNYLAVAYTDEGVELRKAGITMPIMVMNPEEQSFETLIQYGLEPEIYSFRVLSRLDACLKNISSNTPPYKARERAAEQPVTGNQWEKPIADYRLPLGGFPIHIKLETGMHRLGFEEQDIQALIVCIQNNPLLKIKSVFSHLAASEDPQHDVFTRKQIAKFQRMSEEIISWVKEPVLRHILNSAGIIRFPEAQFDMVRIGIGLYGIAPTGDEQRQLENVSVLKTTVSQIKKVVANNSIGYGRAGITTRHTRIAIVGIGYADGLNRKLGNGIGKMLIHGQFASIIGNICMDMCMLDITDIPVEEGDEVIVFGDKYPVTQLAKDLCTIPYEVMTSISQRVKNLFSRIVFNTK